MDSKLKPPLALSSWLFFFFFGTKVSFSTESTYQNRNLDIPLLCPKTNHILKFSWLKKVFQPCQAFKEDFTLTNTCFNRDPFSVSVTGSLFLSTKGVELKFKAIKLEKTPQNWGEKIFIGFKILDETQKKFFKVKEIREISLKIKDGQFSGRPESTMVIYGSKNEGGQDQYETLIENDLEGVNKKGVFRFYLTLKVMDEMTYFNSQALFLKTSP